MSTTSILRLRLVTILALLLLISSTIELQAQSFGRNKPSYKVFDFKVYQSPHFEFYHYLKDDSVVWAIANTYEKWYTRHQRVFRDTIKIPNPIIIYENHPDFQQTTAISGEISIGTQGVTEALKNRIVMPILETNSQTDHVIGHELVHVFQFRIIFNNDSLSLRSLQNLPLWLVEGMAEYLSIGNTDAHTAMIMRDAIHNNDFPTLKQMTRNYKYNPYRYGHAFVSFIANSVGDSIIQPIFVETAKFGYERAFERIFGLKEKNISELWKKSWTDHLAPFLNDSIKHQATGSMLINDKNAGDLNISPSYSPDGKYFTFFSEKNLFSLDLFLADAKTGRIIRKLSSSTRNQDIDGFNFFESVGSWSPDGSQFAYVAVKKGRNILVIADVKRPRRTREIVLPQVASFNNPSWSPDGSRIAISALVDGRNNLYLYDLNTQKTEQITNDRYSYIHPQWSPDGRYLAFATDRKQTSDMSDQINFHFNLGIMDMSQEGRPIEIIEVFKGAENLNPQFAPDGKSLYFLSNRDGFRNLYQYHLDDKKVYQLTNYYTGISGITHLSPAISIARKDSSMVYSYYSKGKYQIYRARLSDFKALEVQHDDIDFTAAILPPNKKLDNLFVTENINSNAKTDTLPASSFLQKPYRPKFGLSYIGSSGVGVSTSSWGTGLAGGVNMMFSDITGDNQIVSTLAVNGEVYDFGGLVGYINQKHRIKFGAMVSHIPYRMSAFEYKLDTLRVGDQLLQVENLVLYNLRQFEDNVGVFAYYPISTTRRIELGGSLSWYYYRMEAINNYYYGFQKIHQSKEKLPAPSGFNLQRINLAYVGDRSQFGMASPMAGHRYRFQVEQYFGEVDMTALLADFRQYYFLKPFSFAFRLTHFGRYGNQADNNLFYPLYLGYMGYMRGYEGTTYYRLQQQGANADIDIKSLFGSKMILGGLEVKIPFTGPKRLALINSGFLFTELAWFLDAGVAWYNNEQITFDPEKAKTSARHKFPVFSTGPSLRINLFGAMILEPYVAFPFQRKGLKEAVWGLNFLPGW